MKFLFALLLTITFAQPAFAEEVELLIVKATQSEGLWKFDVTIHHPDVGSEHMMDRIAIFSPNDVELEAADVPMPSVGAKHVTTQIKGVEIPKGVEYVIIRGHCSADGWTDTGIIIALM